jgi:DNA polymerase I-like protein with 3'-5' exonuclease and polymerase domains
MATNGKTTIIPIDALPNQVEQKTGRVHTDYANSSRYWPIESSNLICKSIPVRTEGRTDSKAFIARDEITHSFLPIILKLNYV